MAGFGISGVEHSALLPGILLAILTAQKETHHVLDDQVWILIKIRVSWLPRPELL
jgi:hypothetical protein